MLMPVRINFDNINIERADEVLFTPREPPRGKDLSVYEDEVVDSGLLNQLMPFGPAIETIFNPFVSKMLRKNPPIIKCSLAKFMKKFKIDSDILEPMKPIWEEFECILAGGKMIDFLFNKKIENSLNDYDIFFISHNPSKVYASIERFLVQTLKYTPIVSLNHVSEFTKDNIKLQLIRSLFANQYDILEDFDIRACSICTDGKYVYWVKGCIEDNKDKKIVMSNPRGTIHGFYRIIKYIEKGYDIRVPDLALASIKFLDCLSIKKINPKHLEEIIDRSFAFDRGAVTMDYEELEQTDVVAF